MKIKRVLVATVVLFTFAMVGCGTSTDTAKEEVITMTQEKIDHKIDNLYVRVVTTVDQYFYENTVAENLYKSKLITIAEESNKLLEQNLSQEEKACVEQLEKSSRILSVDYDKDNEKTLEEVKTEIAKLQQVFLDNGYDIEL